MGASPQQRAMQAAKESVEAAQKQQKELFGEIKQTAGEYRQRAEDVLGTLEGAAGTKLPDYIAAAKSQFGDIPTIQATQQKYQDMLSGFDPGLIGSASEQRLRGSLNRSAQEYGQGINTVANQVSGRLYKTLDEPQKQFERLASSAATNLQLDPMAMIMATRPQTIRSDVGSMKNLYTYNV